MFYLEVVVSEETNTFKQQNKKKCINCSIYSTTDLHCYTKPSVSCYGLVFVSATTSMSWGMLGGGRPWGFLS